MAIRLFTALRLEDQSLRLTIQEAATSLATAYKVTLKVMLLSPKCAFMTYWRFLQWWFWNLVNWSLCTANFFGLMVDTAWNASFLSIQYMDRAYCFMVKTCYNQAMCWIGGNDSFKLWSLPPKSLVWTCLPLTSRSIKGSSFAHEVHIQLYLIN